MLLLLGSIFTCFEKSFAVNYYKPPPDPICPEGFKIDRQIEKKIPDEFLPKPPRNQGKTPSCGPHAVLDAYGIFLKGFAPDPWILLQALNNLCSPSTPYVANPVDFALFLRKHPELIQPHSGRTVAEQVANSCTTSSDQEISSDLLFQIAALIKPSLSPTSPKMDGSPPPFNIETWDDFGGKEEMLHIILNHFHMDDDRQPTQSLIFATTMDDKEYHEFSRGGIAAHALNLIGVKQTVCKNSLGEEKVIVAGTFRNSQSYSILSELEMDMSPLLDGMLKYQQGFYALEPCGSSENPCWDPPIKLSPHGNALYHLVSVGDAQGIQKLIDSGVRFDPNLGVFQSTPLYTAAAQKGNLEVVTKLLAIPGIQINQLTSLYPKTALANAAGEGHGDIVEKLLSIPGIDVNLHAPGEPTPLFMAAAKGHTKIVAQLLAVPGIQVNEPGVHGGTPLNVAAQKGHVKVIAQLLNVDGIDANRPREDGATPLIIAAFKGHTDAVIELLKSGKADVDQPTPDGVTALYVAAQEGRADIVQHLLRVSQKSLNQSIKDGATPLHVASLKGHAEVVAELLATQGIEVNHATLRGMTPLYEAAREGHSKVVALLLDAQGMQVDQPDGEGATPLMMAAQNGHADVVRLFLKIKKESKIDINRIANGYTALYLAAQNGHERGVAEFLEDPRTDVNKVMFNGLTALHVAAHFGRDKVIKELLKSKIPINLNPPSPEGETPLFLAVARGRLDVVKELLKDKRTEVNRPNSSGTTPLIKAAYHGYNDIIEALLNHEGINVNQPDEQGNTPLFVVAEKGYPDVVARLIAIPTVDVNLPNKEGATPLHIAVYHWKIHAVLELLKSGKINLNSRSLSGATPLYIAVQNRDLWTVNALLQHKGNSIADPDLPNLNLRPLDLAIQGGEVEIGEALLRGGANPNGGLTDSLPKDLPDTKRERIQELLKTARNEYKKYKKLLKK